MRYLLLLTLMASMPVFADFYVVAHKSSQLEVSSVDSVAELYLGRRKAIGGVYVDEVLDREGGIRGRFFQAVVNMGESQVNAYWARLKFSGSMREPEKIETQQELIEKLTLNANAIGYMTEQPPVDSELKVILKINE